MQLTNGQLMLHPATMWMLPVALVEGLIQFLGCTALDFRRKTSESANITAKLERLSSFDGPFVHNALDELAELRMSLPLDTCSNRSLTDPWEQFSKVQLHHT